MPLHWAIQKTVWTLVSIIEGVGLEAERPVKDWNHEELSFISTIVESKPTVCKIFISLVILLAIKLHYFLFLLEWLSLSTALN